MVDIDINQNNTEINVQPRSNANNEVNTNIEMDTQPQIDSNIEINTNVEVNPEHSVDAEININAQPQNDADINIVVEEPKKRTLDELNGLVDEEFYKDDNAKNASFEDISKKAEEADAKIIQDHFDLIWANQRAQGDFGSNLDKNSKENLFKAATNLKNQYDDIDKFVGALKNTDPEFETDLRTILTELKTLLVDPLVSLMQTQKDKAVNPNTIMDNLRYGQAVRKIISDSDTLTEHLDKLALHFDSDRKPVRKMCSDISHLVRMTNSFTSGSLVKPLESEKYDDNGMKIHRINDYSLKDKIDPVTKKTVVDPKTKGKLKQKVYKNPAIDGDSFFARYKRKKKLNQQIEKRNNNRAPGEEKEPLISKITYDYRKTERPLFDHDPCKEDVKQGDVGDCYFLSTLMSVAGRDPQFIRDSMCDNNDGTVTCRFYNEENEPVFVTVEKSAPIELIHYENGEVIPLFKGSQGALWTQMYEKAYAKSGLKNELFKGSGYKSIDSGTLKEAAQHILGPALKQGYVINADLMAPNNDSQAAKNAFDALKTYSKNGSVITCHTPPSTGNDTMESTAGLPLGHAYNLLRITEENGQTMYHVENPHATGSRAFRDDGTAYHEANPQEIGVSKLNEQQFREAMEYVYISDFDKGVHGRYNQMTGDVLYEQYGKSVLRSCEILANNESFLFLDSDEKSLQFGRLRQAALNAGVEFMKSPRDSDEMKSTLNELFTAAKDYKEHCENNPVSVDKFNDKRVNRYFAANIINKLQEVYEFNNANKDTGLKKDAEFEKLAGDVLFEDKHDKEIQNIMTDVISQRKTPMFGLRPAGSPEKTDLHIMRQNVFNQAQSQLKAKSGDFVETMAKFLFLDKVVKSERMLSDEQIAKLTSEEGLRKGINSLVDIPARMQADKKGKSILNDMFKGKSMEKISERLGKELPRILSEFRKDKAVPEAVKDNKPELSI